MIYRQRLVIEGYPGFVITAQHIRDYLTQLSKKLEMNPLLDAVTHRSEKYGWAGWIHWDSSGAHFYAWERPLLFFSVDIYTCNAFAPGTAVAFTQEFFNASELEHTEF